MSINLSLNYGGFTHVGMARDHNEDTFAMLPNRKLFIVADGMGGHNSGEIASKMAIETVDNFINATLSDDEITWPYKYDKLLSDAENRLKVSIRLANDRIFKTAQRNQLYKGMGTTIVALYYVQGVATIANVGDSRCYLLRQHVLRQVSEDHSLVNDLLKQKRLKPEDAAKFPHKNVIVRALGTKKHVEVDLFRLKPLRGDAFLLCSDGLTDMVKDQRIEGILNETPDPKAAAKLLVREANQNGGNDNISVIIAKME